MSDDQAKKDTLRDRIAYLHGENEKLYREMNEVGVAIDPQAVKDLRFELLINTLLGKPDSTVERLEFEEKFQEALQRALGNTVTEAKKQARMSRLHIPGRGPNGQHGGQQ